MEDWLACKETVKNLGNIREITWELVATAFRKALFHRKENIQWLALAYNFIGAIEQKILGLPRVAKEQDSILLDEQMGCARLSEILKKGLTI
jgi:hypothetical protein